MGFEVVPERGRDFRTGKVKGIMCSYNAVNGVPMCANSKLLNETLRNTWGFEGYLLCTTILLTTADLVH
jgi:beta-glucosidase-like glycosyl hydrolase